MFPNQIILEHNKRLKSDEDKQKLKWLKREIFNHNIDISATMRKYFKTITRLEDLTTTSNISFFNFRSDLVNKTVQSRLKKPTDAVIIPYALFPIDGFCYYKGLDIICKRYLKAKAGKLYTNYSYVIKEIGQNVFTVIEPVDNVEMTFDISILKKHFKLPYCYTCHSVQGLSLDEEITLFDCNTPYVDRHFVWTAITRARDLSKITFFEHSKDEIKRLERARMLQYLKLKIDFYKKQDNDAKRLINKDKYIDVEWFTDQINNHERCSLCCNSYYMVLDDHNNVLCNITADRVCNDIGHEKENCQLLCYI